MASILPASFMGLPAAQGLSPDAPADLVALDWTNKAGGSLQIKEVYKQGIQVYAG